jgi:hypothetical protein
MAGARQLSIGFHGGQVVAVRASDEQVHSLRDALGTDGWHELVGEDGAIRLDLAQVAYVRTENDEHRVGFGA